MASIGARVVAATSNAARKVGQALDSMGAQMEVAKHTERLVPSTRFVAVDGVGPTVSESARFVAPSANVIGNVSLGPDSSVWYGTTLRGDVNKLTVGSNTCILDRAVVHVAKIQGDLATSIGDNVIVGPGATVHAASIKDSVQIGASAQILDGSTVGPNAVVAPGSVVPPGTTIPAGELWAGSPAKSVRKLSAEEVTAIAATADETANLAALHAAECAKTYEELATDDEDIQDKLERDPEYWPRDSPDVEDVLGQGAPGRIFDDALNKPEEGLKLAKKRATDGQ